MGLTYIEGEATGLTGKTACLTFLVDSGTSYCVLPEPVWQAIDLSPIRSQAFYLPDGTRLERDVSECYLRAAGSRGHVPVILGKPGDEAVLGAIALEVLGLVLDPFQRKLQPLRARW